MTPTATATPTAQPSPTPASGPAPVVREVFAYYNGKGRVVADPLRVDRLLHAELGGSLSELLTVARQSKTNPRAWSDAIEQLVAATRVAFALEPFDTATGGGSSEQQVRDILFAFLDWQQKKKLTSDSLPTSSPPTTPASSSFPTKSSTACG